MTPDETRTALRGRHRKPRRRRAMLATAVLTLAAGAATLIRVAMPDAPDAGTYAGPRPLAPTSASPHQPPQATRTGTPAPPQPSPSSPKPLGGKASAPLTPPEGSTTPLPSREPTEEPAFQPPPSPKPPPPQPTTEPPPPPQTSSTPPPQEPEPEPEDDDAPSLCLPLLNLCLGG
ncbi:hypothetical protein [Streptomyces sp. NPDC085937]|uniref:hypothetical protein n=1 Tax=Streptomyces sp. NPDC085937 TaxID=3365742 RepID=UPI0037D560D8